MIITVRPSKISGRLTAPPSKSMAHRLLISAGLADGVSTVNNIAESEDILATIDCLRALGAEITEISDSGESYKSLRIKGINPRLSESADLKCRESGSTLRFLIPVAALSDKEMILRGSKTLMSRPLSVYEDIFQEQGIAFIRKEREVCVRGRLHGGTYRIPGNISSQFISGLLFSLPMLKEDSFIKPKGKIESRPYIEMTIDALRRFGVRAEWKDEEAIYIPGGQSYKATDARAEGDWSNAAYLMALGAEVDGLDEYSLQGDKICAEYFSLLDAGYAELDITDVPDLAPALMAYAAMKHGCRLIGTRRLRIKESDRGVAMQTELEKFGVNAEVSENEITVGCTISEPQRMLYGHNDHRIVMALTALCVRVGGSIDGAEAVAKSFPDFFDKISEVGVRTDKQIGMRKEKQI